MLDSGLVSAADIEEGQKSAKIESGCKLLGVAAWIHPQCNGRVRHQDRIRINTPYRHLRVLGLTRACSRSSLTYIDIFFALQRLPLPGNDGILG